MTVMETIRKCRWAGWLGGLMAVLMIVGVQVTAVRPAFADQIPGSASPPGPLDPIIDNGSFVQMGINPEGHLNVGGGTASMGSSSTTYVGLRYIPTNGESTAPGCLCEGWGVAAAGVSSFSGYANISSDSGVHNLTVQAGTGTYGTDISTLPESVHSQFKSIVTVTDTVLGTRTLRVTHDYHPSASPNLYQVDVTIENIGTAAIGDLRYRRVMDWDIAPYTFDEYVEIHVGTATDVIRATTDGFDSANPLSIFAPGYGSPPTTLVSGSPDYFGGHSDQGALFDFGFGALGVGESKTFKTYYGAAADRAGALAALGVVGAEVYSLGLPRNADGTAGVIGPHAFIFAFGEVGGTPVPEPAGILMLGSALVGLAAIRRRKTR